MSILLSDIPNLFGHFLSAVGLGVFGFAMVRFALEVYHKSNWQLQMAILLGLFGLLVGLADFVSPGSVGAFALGAGAAFLMSNPPKAEKPADTSAAENNAKPS